MEFVVDERLFNLTKLSYTSYFSKSGSFSLHRPYVSLVLEALVLVLSLVWLSTKLCRKRRGGEDLGRRGSKLNIPTVRWSPLPIPLFDSFYTLYKLRKFEGMEADTDHSFPPKIIVDGLRFCDAMREKYGLLIRLPVLFTEFYFVADTHLAQKILSSSSPGHLKKNGFFYEKLFPGEVQNALVSCDVETWARHRKILNRAFTFKSLQSYLGTINKYSRKLCQSLEGIGNAGFVKEGVIQEKLYFCTLKIISDIVIGCKTDILTDEEWLQFHANFITGKNMVSYRVLQPWFLFDTLWWFHPKKWELERVLQSMHRLITKIIDDFKAKLKTERERGKILGYHEDDEIGLKPFRCMVEEMLYCEMEDEEILSEVLLFMMAGYETTAVAVNLLLFHLALNPNEQLKCREEIDSVFNSKSEPGPDLTMDDLSDLKHLERCIYESLRLTPIFPFFVRTLNEPLAVDDDFELQQGTNIAISPWMQRSSEYYPNPEKFDSDRFLPENSQKRNNFAFLAWSAGKRNCIGWKFSLIEMKVMMAFILRNFEVFTTDKLEDVKFEFDISLRWDTPIDLQLKKREV